MNNSSFIDRGTESCAASVTDSPLVKAIKTVVFSIILMVALTGNIFILAMVYRKKSLRRTTNIFIANMAASDLFIAVVVIPRLLVELYIGPERWLVGGSFGEFLCKFSFSFEDFSVCISIASHAVIAVDRFWAIVFPLRPSPITPARRKYIIAGIWLLSFILDTPNLYIYRLAQGEDGKTYCRTNWAPFDYETASKSFFAVTFSLVICVPTLLMIVLYSWLVISLNSTSTSSTQSNQVRKQRRKEDIRVLIKVVVMVSVFLISLIPITVLTVLAYFVWGSSIPCGAWAYTFTGYILFLSNSAINPWLCVFLHESYRKCLSKTFCRRKQHLGKDNSERNLGNEELATFMTTAAPNETLPA